MYVSNVLPKFLFLFGEYRFARSFSLSIKGFGVEASLGIVDDGGGVGCVFWNLLRYPFSVSKLSRLSCLLSILLKLLSCSLILRRLSALTVFTC